MINTRWIEHRFLCCFFIGGISVFLGMKNRQSAEVDLQGLQPFSYDDSGNSCGSSIVSDFTGNEDECVLQVSDLDSESNDGRSEVLQVNISVFLVKYV